MPRQPMAGFVTLTQEAVTAAEDVATVASPELIEKGRQAFASLGCAACHQFGHGEQRITWADKAPKFADMKTGGGCLAEQPAASVPNFAMSPRQRDDITAAILASRGPNATVNVASAKSEINQIMLR